MEQKSNKKCDSHRQQRALNYSKISSILACRVYRLRNFTGGNLCEMINHKSLFSFVRMDQCQQERQRERERCVLSLHCLPAFLTANSPTFAFPSPSYL